HGWPGGGRRWVHRLAALRPLLERRGRLLLATRDLSRRPRIRPARADDLPAGLLLQQVHLLILARRAVAGLSPPGPLGTAALAGLLAGLGRAPAYKVLVELPLEALRWTQGEDQPL